MKNQIIIMLGFNAGDAPMAESLLDWCYSLNGKTKIDATIGLIAAGDVHAEMQKKVKIAGEVAFRTVDNYFDQSVGATKAEGTNQMLKMAAHIVGNTYRFPWLWLEPDCVPTKQGWLELLTENYFSQDRRYFGPHLRFKSDESEKTCLGRVAIYPNNAAAEIGYYCNNKAPFNQFAAETLTERSTKCRLIQQIDIRGEEDFDKIRPDAVLLHSDKTGAIISRLRSQSPPVPEKIDGRTKQGRSKKAELIA